MKRLTKLLCLAVAMLWVLPASALEFNQHGRAILTNLTPPSSPELESVQPLSEWIAAEVDEFRQFDIADYRVDVEILNATWNNTSTELVIQAFDETGAVVATSSTFSYDLDDSLTPFVVTISAGSISGANSFVSGLHSSDPDARRIQIRPTLEIQSVQDCDQQVMMKTQFRYDGALVGTDRPDHLVVPPNLLNSC